MAMKRLQSEYKQYIKDTSPCYSLNPSESNFLKWNIILFGPNDTIFEGGIFNCILEFPKDYPNKPPVFKFTDNMFHPNIFPDGRVCMSILHEGVDVFGYEHISERWNPSHSVNSILLSLLSILTEPNFESPANIDACKLWKENYPGYKKKIYKLIASK
jgi:ubiquitin-conjugating enzyme E2 G1